MSGFTPCDQPELAILDLRALLQPLVVDTGAGDARDVQQASQLHCHLFTRAQSFLDALGRTVNHLLHNFSCVAVGGWFFTVEGSRVAKKGWLARSMDGGWRPTAARSSDPPQRNSTRRKFPPRVEGKSPPLLPESLLYRDGAWPDFLGVNEHQWGLPRL